jgi:c-di-GMP-binding flagellar brake protein YcgR
LEETIHGAEAHPFSEKRRFRRKELMTSAVMQVRSPSGETVTNYGIIKDISMGGVCFTLYDFNEESINGQEEFTFLFRLPNRKEFSSSTCTLKRVKRLVYTVQVAATFSEIENQDRPALEQFCV